MRPANHDLDAGTKKALFSNLSVLTIDDNPSILNLLKQVLRALDVGHVLQANSASTGMQYLDAHTVDIVICDLLMEPTDGLEFTRDVRRTASYRQPWVPIIILQGFSDINRILEARAAGATDFLTKPFAPSVLFKRIADVIERPRLFVQVESYYGPCRRRRKSTEYDGPERRSQIEQTITDVAGERPDTAATNKTQSKQATG